MTTETERQKRTLNLSPLEALLHSRYGGAVSIRGIRFQILYSINRAFSLFAQPESASLRLEGIEDLDLIGLTEGDNFIQVKTSVSHWKWSQLKKPIEAFIAAMRLAEHARFSLVFNFPLERDYLRLAESSSLAPNDRKRLENKFQKLCRSCGATTAEASTLLSLLSVESTSEAEVVAEIHRKICDQWDVPQDAVDIYFCVLVSAFLDWAHKRAVVTTGDLEDLRSRTGEGIARESAFEAYGRGLLQRLDDSKDANADEFFMGKGTRLGQVIAGLDVRRPKWSQEISTAVNSGSVCVIRSSSGQGKSAMMFRYVVDHWILNTTFQLRVAETPEQAELACEFLRGRQQLNLPTYLIIDNADWRTREWPRVADVAQSVGIPVLVTTRHEDWYRFGVSGVANISFVEPDLTRSEAQILFDVLKKRKFLHDSAESSDKAYDEIGETKLLMEFLYLITQGTLLRARLEDQIQTIRRLNEDPAKLDILRLVSLGHVLSSDIDVRKLLSEVPFRDDRQGVVNSIRSEFVEVAPDEISGLHHLRSRHVADLLHDEVATETDTAIRLLNVVPDRAYSTLVFNAMQHPQIDSQRFQSALSSVACQLPLDKILAVLDGLFHAGEMLWIRTNRATFRTVFETFGGGVHTIIAYKYLPMDFANAWEGVENLLSENREDFAQLDASLVDVQMGERGLDLCRHFLNDLTVSPEGLRSGTVAIGHFLIWLAQTRAETAQWELARETVLKLLADLRHTPEEICVVLEGFGRYAESEYEAWFAANGPILLSWLRYQTETYRIDLADGEVFVEYFVDGAGDVRPHEQTMNRLELLRRALPNCSRFNCQGNWLLPTGSPSVDDTFKHIPRENLPLKSDTMLNGRCANLFHSEIFPKLSWSLQKLWSEVRRDSLDCVRELNQILSARAAGRTARSTLFDDPDYRERLVTGLRDVPTAFKPDAFDSVTALPRDMRVFMEHQGPKQWSTGFENFVRCVTQFMSEPSEQLNRLCRINFYNAEQNLTAMHDAFEILFRNSPDYFDTRLLNETEIQESQMLIANLQVWLAEPPRKPISNVMSYIEIQHRQAEAASLQRIRSALSALSVHGIETRVANRISVPQFLFDLNLQVRQIAISFQVVDDRFPEQSLLLVVAALIGAKDDSDVFWLIPESSDTRLIDGAYHFSSHQLAQIEEGMEPAAESFVPARVPEDVITDGLRDLPLRVPPQLQLRGDIIRLFQLVETQFERERSLSLLSKSGLPWDQKQFAEGHEHNVSVLSAVPLESEAIRGRLKMEFATFQDTAQYRFIDAALRKMAGFASRPEDALADFPQLPAIDEIDIEFHGLCLQLTG